MTADDDKEPEAEKPPAKPKANLAGLIHKPRRRERPKPFAFGSRIRRVTRIHLPGSGYW